MAALSPNGKRRIRVTEGEISPLSPCGIRKNIMEIDFDARDAISDFISVPAGTYVCRITEVRTGTTRAGDERWSIRLVVDEGMPFGHLKTTLLTFFQQLLQDDNMKLRLRPSFFPFTEPSAEVDLWWRGKWNNK